jgi:hypothetical protein
MLINSKPIVTKNSLFMNSYLRITYNNCVINRQLLLLQHNQKWLSLKLNRVSQYQIN